MKFSNMLLIGLVSLTSFGVQSQTAYWSPIAERDIKDGGQRQIVPQKYVTYQADLSALDQILATAPHEREERLAESHCIISLPMPNGGSQRFRVVYSPIMAGALAAAYPDIRTYSVKGIDDPYASGKLDRNAFGLHGMILSANGDFFIDPYNTGSITHYISYYTTDFVKDPAMVIPEAGVIGMEEKPAGAGQKTGAKAAAVPPGICVGAELRTFQLAVACTGEYAKAATGQIAPTVAQTLAKIVTSVNRVDGVYEKEVAIRLELVPTETMVIFTDPATDPFTGNNNANTLIGESQTVITSNIGSANFDIGHTFSTGGGGLANFGCVCSTNNKAKGITGSNNPVGDPYDIDYVAHEMGHQFRGSHSFNAITGSCNGNRNSSAAVEPGSGVTIMAYAGLCSSNNVAGNSIPYFHAISYDEIVNFVHTGSANSCAVTSTTGNLPPVVTGSGDYVIPKSTPFVLTGSGTDPDGDPITYSWEEMDLGAAGGNWNSGNAPYFRSYTPTTTPTRLFPLNNIAFSGNFTNTIGEYLPGTAQLLHFRLTARDNKMGGGGVCFAANTVSVDASGPLSVTYPSTTGIVWMGNTQETVVWAVNGTDQPPVGCDSVRILITTNLGATYTVISASTPNDGSQLITVPTVTAPLTTCRIKVQSKGNIFYDVSNNNFTITVNPDGVGVSEHSRNNPMALSVWPNPFSNQLSLAASNLKGGPTEVTVLDLLGKELMKQEYWNKTELQQTLDLSHLSNGLYFIRLSNDNRQSVYRAVKE